MMRENGGFKAHTARLGRGRSKMFLQHRRLKGKRKKNKARKETHKPCRSFMSSSERGTEGSEARSIMTNAILQEDKP